MNPESILNEVAKAIDNRKVTTSKRYHITLWDGKFACVPTSESVLKDRIFGTFNDDELTIGLSCKQWARLSEKIAEYYRREAEK